MWEYLSLYAERDNFQEVFFVKNYPESYHSVREEQLLNELGREGWELVAVTPAYQTSGGKLNHQLYLRRKLRSRGDESSE
jgi:hypothetical protein